MDRLPKPMREALLFSLSDIAGDGIIVLDAAQNIVFFSRSAERTFGYSSDEVLGRPLDAVLPSGTRALHHEAVDGFTSAAANRAEMAPRTRVRARRKDGSTIPVEATIGKFVADGAVYLVAIIRDVSARQHVEKALAESEERYHSIVSAMSEGVVMQDAQGRIIECNESAEQILGLSRDQLMGQTSFDPRWSAIHPDGSPTTGDEHPIVITRLTGQPQHDVVLGIHRPDGTLVWTSTNTQPLFRAGEEMPYAVVATFADITDVRDAGLRLRESEAQYRALFENNLDASLLTAPDGRILAANPAACMLFGYTQEELCELGRAGVVDTSDPAVIEALAERARLGNYRGELTLMRKDGTRFIGDVSSAFFADANGRQLTSMLIRDITETKQSLELLEQKVDERTQELTALLGMSRVLSSTIELQSLAELILLQLQHIGQYDCAAIALTEGNDLRIIAYEGSLPRDAMLGLRVGLDPNSPYRRAVSGEQEVIFDDLSSNVDGDLAIPEEIGLPGSDLLRSWMAVPLVAKGKPIGLLRIASSQPKRFGEEDVELLQIFASLAGVAIDNVFLYRRSQQAAALEERHHLARELHDSVSQQLYGIVLGARTAKALVEASPIRAEESLDYVLSLARVAFAEMRALIFELLPDSLETEGLIAAIKRQIEILKARVDVEIEMSECTEPSLAPAAKEVLYRIAQEALSNVTKHAQARHVTVRLCEEGSAVVLEISDDGTGFDLRGVPSGHMGLQSMRERAESLGGTFNLTSEIGKGTRIEVRIPASAQ